MVQAEASGKTCFDIGEAQPIDAERAGWGEYEIFFEIQQKYHLSRYHTPPLSPSILEGGIDTQLFNYSHRYNRNLSF